MKKFHNILISKNSKVDFAYEQLLSNFINEPREQELNQMEKDLKSSINNPNFQPLKGA